MTTTEAKRVARRFTADRATDPEKLLELAKSAANQIHIDPNVAVAAKKVIALVDGRAAPDQGALISAAIVLKAALETTRGTTRDQNMRCDRLIKAIDALI